MWSRATSISRREVLNDGRVLARGPGRRRATTSRAARDLHPAWRALHVPARPWPTRRSPSVARQGRLGRQRRADAATARARRMRSRCSGSGRSASSAAGTSTSRSRSGDGARATRRRTSSSTSGSPAAGGWEWKDADVLEERIAEGRFTAEQVAATWAEGHRVAALLDAGEHWWATRGPTGRRRPAGTRRGRSRPVRCQTRLRKCDLFATEVKRRRVGAVQSSGP